MNQTEINKVLKQAKELQISLEKMASQAIADLPNQMAKLTDKEKIKMANDFMEANLDAKINEMQTQIKDVNKNNR